MPTIVSDLMSRTLYTLKESDDLGMARALLLHRKIRHLPVVRAGRLVGLITSQSLVRAEAEVGTARSSTRSVADAMVRKIRTARPRLPLRRAAKTMIEEQIGCLPVVEADGTLVGILTDTDLVRFAADAARDLDEIGRAICRAAE